MKKSFIVLMLFLVSLGTASAQEHFSFKDGKFRIVQFTDLHWDQKSPKGCAKTIKAMKYVLEKEKPDLAILTGDVVTEKPALEGWNAVIKFYEEMKMPFSVTLGNHEGECMDKDEIFDLLVKCPYFVGSHGPEDIHGTGNFTIPVYSSDQSKVATVLYCFDSHDYPENDDMGYYDWIHFDQVEWYRQQSKKYTAGNGGEPLPALAFFHIAVPEYYNLIGRKTTMGQMKEEGIGCSDINGGLFASFLECGDVMATFVGHDHDNDFLGQEKGILLAYGRVTGEDAYGDFVRGGRVIDLYEGERRLDTWITTPKGKEFTYYFPSGITSIDEAEKYLPAKKVKPTENGVAYNYYEGKFKTTDQLLAGKIKESGTMESLTIANAPVKDYFGYDFKTWIYIPKKAVYFFDLFSDDGSRLFIDGKEIIDNDGSHSIRMADGKIALEAGYHEMRILYFETYMGEALKLRMTDRWGTKWVTDDMLFVPAEK